MLTTNISATSITFKQCQGEFMALKATKHMEAGQIYHIGNVADDDSVYLHCHRDNKTLMCSKTEFDELQSSGHLIGYQFTSPNTRTMIAHRIQDKVASMLVEHYQQFNTTPSFLYLDADTYNIMANAILLDSIEGSYYDWRLDYNNHMWIDPTGDGKRIRVIAINELTDHINFGI